MKRRALAAAAVLVLAAGFSTALPAAAAQRPHGHGANIPFPYKGRTCFDGPVGKDHAVPEGACWEGALCLKDGTHFLNDDNGVWCMGQGSYDFKHRHLTHHVVGLQNSATKDRNYFGVDLVGYVTYDPGNPIPGHALWPFRNPHLDHAFDGAPVVQLVYVPGGPPITHSTRVECVVDITLAENLPATYGRCGKEAQFARDLHGTYFVWTAPGHRFEAVHITNASQHSNETWCLFADDPGVDDPPWYVRLRHPQGPVDLIGVLQFWYERKIHA